MVHSTLDIIGFSFRPMSFREFTKLPSPDPAAMEQEAVTAKA
jgi:hypothetical protein